MFWMHAGQLALHRAASTGSASIIRLLIAEGCNVNLADKVETNFQSTHSPTHAWHQQIRCLKTYKTLLIDGSNEAKVTYGSIKAQLCLNWDSIKAIFRLSGSIQALFSSIQEYTTVKTARENISDLTFQNFGDVSQEGTTPLHLAMYERREEAALALLDAGASTSAKNTR